MGKITIFNEQIPILDLIGLIITFPLSFLLLWRFQLWRDKKEASYKLRKRR